MAFDKREYDKAKNKELYSKFSFYVPKRNADDLRELAKREGISVNQLLHDAVRRTYGLDLLK